MYQRSPLRRIAARRGPARVAAPAQVPDWSRLGRGDDIEVLPPRGTAVAGTIDMIAPDRSVFWMIRRDGGGRTMVCSGDDVSVAMVARAKAARPPQHEAAEAGCP